MTAVSADPLAQLRKRSGPCWSRHAQSGWGEIPCPELNLATWLTYNYLMEWMHGPSDNTDNTDSTRFFLMAFCLGNIWVFYYNWNLLATTIYHCTETCILSKVWYRTYVRASVCLQMRSCDSYLIWRSVFCAFDVESSWACLIEALLISLLVCNPALIGQLWQTEMMQMELIEETFRELQVYINLWLSPRECFGPVECSWDMGSIFFTARHQQFGDTKSAQLLGIGSQIVDWSEMS